MALSTAAELGAAEIACDTSEPATRLHRYDEKRGYRVVARTKWDMVSFESLILSKELHDKRDGAHAPKRRSPA